MLVSYANIIIKNQKKYTITDENGILDFSNVVDRDYELIISIIEILQDTLRV